MEKELRTEHIHIKLTEAEKDMLSKAAEKSGLSISAFLRMKLIYEKGAI